MKKYLISGSIRICRLNVLSYFKLSWPFCSVEQIHLCNIERGHNGQHLCASI